MPPHPAGTINIIVENLTPEGKLDAAGEVLIACFNDATSWMKMDQIFRGGQQPCPDEGDSVRFRLQNCPPGTYACCVLIDRNGNQKLDVNIMGYPLEAYAFSSGAVGRFGPPAFEEAAFEHRSETTLRIKMP